MIASATGSRWWIAIVAAMLATACSVAPGPPSADPDPEPATVILIGVDALRWDLYQQHPPALSALKSRGVSARRLIPPFPTKTFPSFYTLATGLHPGSHGLVGNNIRDPALGVDFSLYDRDAVSDGRWYGGEPIWVTAERQGVRTAAYYWPGSEAEIGGYRPSRWLPYDGAVPDQQRVAEVLQWLELPEEERPRLILLYFSTIDEAAHEAPPLSAEVADALLEVDRALAALIEGIERLDLERSTNLVVASDHGMAPTASTRTILVDDLLDPDDADILDENPLLWIYPRPGREEALLESLQRAHPHLSAYARDRVPQRYRYDQPRIAPIVVVADEGWSFASRAELEDDPTAFDGSTHGYDNRRLSMGATLIAAGPAFRSGVVAEEVESVHVYPLICRVLGIEAAAGDGDLKTVAHWLEP